MTNPNFDDDEKPLDPAVKNVETRVRRLILISGLTLGLGIFAVFGAILYRIVNLDTTPTVLPLTPTTAVPSLTLTQMGLPGDAALVSSAVEGGGIVLTYRHSAGHTLVFLDAATLAVVRKLELPGG